MTLEMAAIAANRFGLGAAPGDLQHIKSDPKGWLLEQLASDVPLPGPIAQLPPTGSDQIAFPLVRTMAAQASGRAGGGAGGMAGQRRQMQQGRMPGENNAPPQQPGGNGMGRGTGLRASRTQRAVKARFDTVRQTKQPFRERLIHFWGNHFVVSAAKATAFSMPASFERDVARLHVGHRFEDMLVASSTHPAMLFYLDNFTSIGPNSKWGKDPSQVPFVSEVIGRPEGLNENLAREILELHTVGVNGGYTQADVTSFAKVITGWGYNLPRRGATGSTPGGGVNALMAIAKMGPKELFYFNANAHEPGSQTVMGKSYSGDGVEKGLAVLEDLAAHPKTAEFIATKLVRHFIADAPPPAAVASCASAFLKSGGDLPTVYRALIDTPEAWDPSLRKTKRPEEYLMSALRALEGPDLEGGHLISLLAQMGQPAFMQPGPDGWADTADNWTGADALWKRLEWATIVAKQKAPSKPDPAGVAVELLGPTVSAQTLTEIKRAESPEQGLAMLLVSPEFLRR
ncbi:MAG: DUF1800 domain-containing protein [Sphingorhabdus sp.]